MPTKHFIIDPTQKKVRQVKKDNSKWKEDDAKREGANSAILNDSETLVHPEGRVIIKINVEGKNWHRFEDGTTIRYERQYNNLNRRQTEAVNAVVVSGEGLTPGTEILIHHNAIADHHQIHNYKQTIGTDIRYYSIPEDMAFVSLVDGEWAPIYPYETALRVFKPYEGILEGIDPTLIKDTLFVTSGDLKNQVVKTISHVDYEIVFQDTNVKESRIVRFRPMGDERNGREEEAMAIMGEMTDKVMSGKLLVGYSISDAKKLSEYGK